MNGRILVVDDQRDIADSLARLISAFGHDSQAAYSGEQAIEAAASFRPDLIFVDLAMPGCDGYETVAGIRRRPECGYAIMIALTGWTRREDRQRAYASGFDLYTPKPLSIEALKDCLALLNPSAGESTAKRVFRLASEWTKSKRA